MEWRTGFGTVSKQDKGGDDMRCAANGLCPVSMEEFHGYVFLHYFLCFSFFSRHGLFNLGVVYLTESQFLLYLLLLLK